MRFFYLIFLSLGLNVFAFSQSIEWGVEAAGNATIIYHISPYQLNGGYTQLTPLPGWLGGVFLRWHSSEKRFIKTSLSYESRTLQTGPILLTDANGQPTRAARVWMSNNYVNWNFMYFFKFTQRISLGVGVNNHFLLFSKTHFTNKLNVDNTGATAPKNYRNYFYKPYWLSIPVTFNIDFDRLNLWFTYDSAIMSRLNKNSVYKEMENSIQIGMGYRFLRKKD